MGMSLGSGGGKKGGGIAPNINVTPLVDVVLVLLIIFMVVIPNVQDGKAIEMVQVQKADENADETEPLTVTIDGTEGFTYGTDDMPRNAVIGLLRNDFDRDPGQPVLIRADATLRYAVVRELFKDVQDVGFQQISLAVGVAREWDREGGGES